MAMTGGGYAEMVAIDHRLALPVPAKFTWARAAATPTVYVTAHDALVSQGGVTAGTQLLVQGASTGTGIAAVQIAHAWKADRVFGTAGTDDKVARLRALGCDTPINYRTSDVAKLVLEATQERGVELVLDLLGGAPSPQTSPLSRSRAGSFVSAGSAAPPMRSTSTSLQGSASP